MKVLYTSERLSKSHRTVRSGKVLVLVSVCLPMLFGLLTLVIDGSLLMVSNRDLQTLADVSATRAAKALTEQDSLYQAVIETIQDDTDFADISVSVHNPPLSGAYAGDANYVEVELVRDVPSHFAQVVGGAATQSVRSRAVAGLEVSTVGAAITVLDPDPSPVTITGLPRVC